MKEWTISWIPFWTILSEIMTGKNSIMAEINESKSNKNNIKVQRVHECIKYERDQLIEIALKCKQDSCCKIINKVICVKIREYRLSQRYKKGGKRLKITYRKLVQQHNTLNINNLINISCNGLGSNSNRDNTEIALISAQSPRIKELMLYDYIRESNTEMCTVTETWLQN